MGYRGKVVEQEQARELRALGWTMPDIAVKLGVSKGSVSLWVRDVPFTPAPRRMKQYGSGTGSTHPQHLAKLRQIEELDREAVGRLGLLSDQAFLSAGIALYAGEGSKRDGAVKFANSDAAIMSFFCDWLRAFFVIDESRVRARIYLHQGLDLDGALSYWSEVTGVPMDQFGKPYRAVPDVGIRHNKHENGCATFIYSCTKTHRAIMGLCRALLSCDARPFRGGEIGITRAC